MKETQLIMGMPITVEITDTETTPSDMLMVFNFFKAIDERFSTYKTTSEISQINEGKIHVEEYSHDMLEVLALCEETKEETNGFFDIKNREGLLDPSGLVKGWSIYKASLLLQSIGRKNYYIDAGGDIEVSGISGEGTLWTTGIRNPFNENEIIKVVYLKDQGIATSGTYIRGQHIYNPLAQNELLDEIVSLTVIGPNIYEADRFATAAFAMGNKGIHFIEKYPQLAGYAIDKNGIATMTTNFSHYTQMYA